MVAIYHWDPRLFTSINLLRGSFLWARIVLLWAFDNFIEHARKCFIPQDSLEMCTDMLLAIPFFRSLFLFLSPLSLL